MTEPTTAHIGIDLGGTKILSAIVDTNGTIIEKIRIDTPQQRQPENIVDAIVPVLTQLQEKSRLPAHSIGIGMAGQIDPKNGDVIFAPNFNWNNVPLHTMLSKAVKMPVSILNDVRAAALAEWNYGAGKGYDDLVLIFIGTGIGGGIVSGGKLVVGANNAAAEVGHMSIHFHGRPCKCGNIGCLEAYAGGWSIGQRLKEAVYQNPQEGQCLKDIAGGKIENLTARAMWEGVRQNDPLSLRLRDDVASALTAGAINIIHAFNPSILILGGGIIDGYPAFIDDIDEGIKARALKATSTDLKVVKATLADDAGIVGAAAYARLAHG